MATYPMRRPCKDCGHEYGHVESRNGQDCVFCGGCRRHCYNAPKIETGRAQRSVSSARDRCKPAQRARILMRANGQCELCRTPFSESVIPHIDHLLAVKHAFAGGLTDEQINSDENMAAMCEACNLGKRAEIIPLWLTIAIIQARLKNKEPSDVGKPVDAERAGELAEPEPLDPVAIG